MCYFFCRGINKVEEKLQSNITKRKTDQLCSRQWLGLCVVFIYGCFVFGIMMGECVMCVFQVELRAANCRQEHNQLSHSPTT